MKRKYRPGVVFEFYYSPMESPKFQRSLEYIPRRNPRPWMTGVGTDENGEWAPGVQRTFLGACWAAWRLYRKMTREERNA